MAVSRLTDSTCFNPQVFATLQINRVLTLLVCLWRKTNFHTLMQRPAVLIMSLKGTSPTKIFRHFFSACGIPSVITLSIDSMACVVELVAGKVGGKRVYIYF